MTLQILAVDDSLTIREMLRHALTGAGFAVALSVDGADALLRLQTFAPDVILTDLNMPVMDGFALIAALRAGPAATFVPIIVLTTETTPALKDRARRAGATAWISKPFDEAALVKTILRVAPA